VSEKCLEWGVDVCIASLDLRNVFDKIEYDSLFGVLHAQTFLMNTSMFSQLCTRTKQAQWRDARPFSYNKGVKQGDALSPELFNAGLEEAISSWKRRLATHGLGDQGTRKNV
jgi:hypothetical protein